MKKTLFALLICSTLAVLCRLSVSAVLLLLQNQSQTQALKPHLMYWHANPLQNGAIK